MLVVSLRALSVAMLLDRNVPTASEDDELLAIQRLCSRLCRVCVALGRLANSKLVGRCLLLAAPDTYQWLSLTPNRPALRWKQRMWLCLEA